MGGGRFEGESTYHGVFKSHEMKKQKPIRQTKYLSCNSVIKYS